MGLCVCVILVVWNGREMPPPLPETHENFSRNCSFVRGILSACILRACIFKECILRAVPHCCTQLYLRVYQSRSIYVSVIIEKHSVVPRPYFGRNAKFPTGDGEESSSFCNNKTNVACGMKYVTLLNSIQLTVYIFKEKPWFFSFFF